MRYARFVSTTCVAPDDGMCSVQRRPSDLTPGSWPGPAPYPSMEIAKQWTRSLGVGRLKSRWSCCFWKNCGRALDSLVTYYQRSSKTAAGLLPRQVRAPQRGPGGTR